MENLIAKATISINAPAERVWDALTNPELVKQYMFGTNLETSLKVGDPITWSGEWEGKAYKDKGVILENSEYKRLSYTYFSAFSGDEDVPENYHNVSYELDEENGVTTLTITQDGSKNDEARKHSEDNWTAVLKQIKEMLEK